MAQTEELHAQNPDLPPANNPAGAAAARKRIAHLNKYPHAGSDYKVGPAMTPGAVMAPATPTADLIIDKTKLADQHPTAPLVRGRKLPSILVPLLTAAGVFIVVLLLFKAPVIINQIQFAFAKKPVATAPAVAAAEVVPAENTISIPKINVKAPVNYEPSIQEAAIQKSLETGVVHYGNTALPGQNGNVAIFGHSSNDWWEPGDYKFVFVLLDKLAPGDQVTMDYNSQRYTYEVTGSRVVEPTEVSVLNPTSTPTLTIITCTPPGTSLKRLVVTAKQISPDPTQTRVAVATPAAGAAATLPNTSPSFMDQLAQAWKGIVSVFSGGSGNADPTATPDTSGSTTSGQLPTAK